MNIRDAGRDKNADPAIAAAVQELLQKLAELFKSIQEATAEREHVWFQNLLCGILNCALQDYRFVEIGAQKSVPLAAWGRRNLLELKVITEYVLASEKNATDFKNDLLRDAKEFYEAMSKRHRSLHKEFLSGLSEMAAQEQGPMKEVIREVLRRECGRGPQTEESDSESEAYKQIMADYGLDDSVKAKRASRMAELTHQKESFDPMFKICSKIMHRTCLSIASSGIRGSLDPIMPFLTDSAVCDLLSVYASINKHIEENGVRPPQN
jgi:hypothetical protein